MTSSMPPPTPRTLALIAAWGAVTALVAFALAGGNIAWFAVWMVILSAGHRLLAYWIVRRRGEHPRRGWWL
jgi:4-hydroxybenzoate polyprenyltransferase